MSKQSIRDEMELLQDHEEHAESLEKLIRDGRIDLGLSESDWQYEVILKGLDLLTVMLDKAIRSRDKQITADDDPRAERGYFVADHS